MDSKNDPILALTTLNHKLEKEKIYNYTGQPAGKDFYAGAVSKSNNRNPGIATATTKFSLEPWRIVNEGQTKTTKGATWH